MRSISIKNRMKNQNIFYAQKRFSENRAVCGIIWKKYGKARQATDENMTCCRKFPVYMQDT